MDSYYVCCGYDLHLDRSVVAFSIYVRYCGTACVYFSFRWGPFVHSLGIVQWELHYTGPPREPWKGIWVGSCHDALVGSKQVGKARFPEYIRNFFSNGAFNVPVDALPL